MKNACPSLYLADDELSFLQQKKTKETRPDSRPRKYHKLENCKIDINELHDFSNILKEDQ